MRAVCFASLSALIVACGAEPEAESETDEGALATAESSATVTVVDSIETPIGQIPSWTTDPQGRVWTLNRDRATLGLVGQRPTFQAPEPANEIMVAALGAPRATLLMRSGPGNALETSILQVDLVTGVATTILPAIIGGDTLAADRAGVAYTVGFVQERSDLNDLIKIDPNGTVTKLAPDILAPRPDKSCRVSLLVDDASVFGIQSCSGGPSEIVQVPKTGGSSKIVAGTAAEIGTAVQSETDVVYSAGDSIMRLPKAGGAAQLIVKQAGSEAGSALAVRGGNVWFTQVVAGADKEARTNIALFKAPLSGGTATRVALLPQLPQSKSVSAQTILSAKDGVHVALLDAAAEGKGPWQHRLVRVVGTEK